MSDFLAELPRPLWTGQKKTLAALEAFKDARGIVQACCGSGKTVTFAIDIERRGEDLSGVFTPYIYLLGQWLKEYRTWFPDTPMKFMCVCSDQDPTGEESLRKKNGSPDSDLSAEQYAALLTEVEASHGRVKVSTNPEEIAEFLRQEGPKVVFCTYASSPVYGEAQRLAGVRANSLIFDEAHWTASGNRMTNATYALHDENVPSDRRIFTTATVRHFRREGMDYSMDNETVYGRHVLVDENGNPDPWTIRKAIDHKEVAPYRIVLSFVTDPSVDPELLQLPSARLIDAVGQKADPAKVHRLLGHAFVLERAKAKYGVKKPLSFYNDVATSRLATSILNVAKHRPDIFPHLSQSDPALSVSSYERSEERARRMETLRNSPEIEISNAQLLLFGANIPTIDCVFFADSMTGNINVIQACGRAGRVMPDKVATIIVPVMLPRSAVNLESTAQTIDPAEIKDAFRKAVEILDDLADADPVVRNQVNSSRLPGGWNNPGIIEFEFPAGVLPELKKAIQVGAWRVIDPEADFINILKQDVAALEQYRWQKHPRESDAEKEARAAQARAAIKIIPQRTVGFEPTAARMSQFRRHLKAHREAGGKDGRYGGYYINDDRVKLICHHYEWDWDFILHDNFAATIQNDALALEQYRFLKHPRDDDQIKDTENAKARADIRIIPWGAKGFESISWRMANLRKALQAYHKAERKPGAYREYFLDEERVELICERYGWDWDFILQDRFSAILKELKTALEQYRYVKHPKKDDSYEGAQTAKDRAAIRIVPLKAAGFESTSIRMNSLRAELQSYHRNGEKSRANGSYSLNEERVTLALHILDWDWEFILADKFSINLKKNLAALNQYRLMKHPHDAEARARIIIIPQNTRGFEVASRQMGIQRRSLKGYLEAGKIDGMYGRFFMNAERANLLYEQFGWNEKFIYECGSSASAKSKKSDKRHYQILPALSHFLPSSNFRRDHRPVSQF